MKTTNILAVAVMLCVATSCVGKKKITDSYTPEESGLNMVKITDESKNTVLSPVSMSLGWMRAFGGYEKASAGYCKEAGYAWSGVRTLAVSPDGTKLAYVTRMNDQDNIMVRRSGAQSAATQRTFRNVVDFSWGPDNRLYFADRNSASNTYICSINAEQGSMITQLTNGSVNDKNPVTNDGKLVFFTRNSSKEGPFIWSYNRQDGTLTSCARGYMPCLIPGVEDAFYCVRNSSEGRSEIWYVNYEKGQETLLVSDVNHSFTNPSLSPDGKWIVMQGNTTSSKNKKKNLDIYVVRTDGSMLTQITYSPSLDTCPVFSPDGQYIYFLSDRGNKDEYFNVWRMTFKMD